MNSIDYINQLIQAVNAINGQMFSLRNEVEQVKKDFVQMKDRVSLPDNKEKTEENNKKHEEQVKVIIDSVDKTNKMMKEMQNKLGSVDELYKRVAVDGDLDYFKVLSKETAEKLKNLEIALTLKANTLERGIRNIPKPITKDEIQSMIDKSLNMLLEGLRPSVQEESPVTVETPEQQVVQPQDQVVQEYLQDVQEMIPDNVIDTNTTSTDDIEVDETPVEVVIQSLEPTTQPKTKRKYNKKK
jgi:hypothetical protein